MQSIPALYNSNHQKPAPSTIVKKQTARTSGSVQQKSAKVQKAAPKHVKKSGKPVTSKASSKSRKTIEKAERSVSVPASAEPAVQQTNLLFNKLRFKEHSKTVVAGGSKKAGKKAVLPKDPKQALAAVEGKQRELSAIREKDPKKAKSVEEKEDWAKAINRAQGIAVRDDPKLLKRTLARQKVKKEAGKKKWEERDEKILLGKKAKQEKRQRNIAARKEAKKDRRVKSSKKGSKKSSKSSSRTSSSISKKSSKHSGSGAGSKSRSKASAKSKGKK